MKKWAIVGLVALLATVAVAPAASAATGEDEARVTLQGRGLLQAGGSGQVEISGAGRVRLVVTGDLTIVDRAGDARVWVRGVPAADDTALTLEGFRGAVGVTGSDFTIEAEGRILLTAIGRGTAVLEGTGWYRVRHDGWGRWSDTGAALAYPA
ncbi:MAG: hypothetical protein MUE66_01950 [Acidimicrobiia bacterium]|jgi:hypothetical protein|nr:hypothetical protein [Acidimicrobiia bacterium]